MNITAWVTGICLVACSVATLVNLDKFSHGDLLFDKYANYESKKRVLKVIGLAQLITGIIALIFSVI